MIGHASKSVFKHAKIPKKEGVMSVTSIFKGHEIFHNLILEEVNQISEFSERRGWDKGDPIFLKGERADKVYLLLEGSVPPVAGARLDAVRD